MVNHVAVTHVSTKVNIDVLIEIFHAKSLTYHVIIVVLFHFFGNISNVFTISQFIPSKLIGLSANSSLSFKL